MKGFSEVCNRAVIKAGLTQTELAKRLGEYQSYVARMESGQRRVDVIEFEVLSKILSFDASEFF